MKRTISAITRTARRIRRSAARLVSRLTRKAHLKVAVTVSLPPFLKVTLDYSADLGTPANDNNPKAAPPGAATTGKQPPLHRRTATPSRKDRRNG